MSHNQTDTNQSRIHPRNRLKTASQLIPPFLVGVLALVGVAPVLAQNAIQITTGNDILAGNSRSDDLYTGGLALLLEFDEAKINATTIHKGFATLEENLFTDRERGERLDETWLSLGRRFEGDKWSASAHIGVVRAGQGVFGEDAQNLIHRAIGDEEVELDYPTENRHYPVVGGQYRRVLPSLGPLQGEARVDLRVAQGYQQWVRVETAWQWNVARWLDVYGRGRAESELGGARSHRALDRVPRPDCRARCHPAPAFPGQLDQQSVRDRHGSPQSRLSHPGEVEQAQGEPVTRSSNPATRP